MVLIARNEAHNVNRCFSSWWADVDEVVLCDTGSKDATIKTAQAFAEAAGEPDKLIVSHFKWVDDFAAARNYADTLATGDLLTWCDLDDEVYGLAALRKIAEEAAPEVSALFTHYSYAQDPAGNIISELWRERLVRNDGTQWEGRLHEHKLFAGANVQVGPDVARWVHHHTGNMAASGLRNLRILKKWDHDEPDNPRILMSLAMQYLGENDWDQAIVTFEQYLTHREEPPQRRAQCARYLSQALCQVDRVQEAEDVAYRALREPEGWDWPDTQLTLGECAQHLGRPDEAIRHCETVIRMGKPNSILILNPLMYTAQPRAIAMIAAMQLNRLDDAMRYAQEVRQLVGEYALVDLNLPTLQSAVLREQAVNAWLQCAQLLEQSGEIEKARDLLKTAPYFAIDDQRLIGKRMGVWQALEHAEPPSPVDVESAAGKFLARHLEMAA